MSRSQENQTKRLELRVLESETKDLKLFDRSDLAFAILYGVLFLWGLVLTLIAI